MIFALLDDGTLAVFADLHDARRDVEFPEIESGDTTFYNERGELLIATFPGRSDRRIFGILITNDPGPFELVLSGTPDESAINIALSRAVALQDNQWFGSLEEVRAHFAKVSSESSRA